MLEMGRVWPIVLVVAGCAATPRPIVAPEVRDADAALLRRLIEQLERLREEALATGLLEDDPAPQVVVQNRDKLHHWLARLIDYGTSLSSISHAYIEAGDEADVEAFLLAYAADLALYVNTALMLDVVVGESDYEAVLAEPAPQLGLPDGAWRDLKTAFNLQPWQRPLAMAHAYHLTLDDAYRDSGVAARRAGFRGYIERRAGDMLELGVTAGPSIFSREVMDLLATGFTRALFPAQRGVAEWLGDTRTTARASLIDAEARGRAQRHLRPGDIILERRNWFLSNLGLPGFWPHAALYVGSPDEVLAELGADTLVRLEARHPEAAAAWRAREVDAPPRRVLEAVSEGVVFSTFEHSADADYVAVLRPRLPASVRAQALERAFAYFGRPYDFAFDFRTDDALVCSEVVFKAYEGSPGLRLPLDTVLGRPILSPNDIARVFDEEHDDLDGRQLDLVLFLDGSEGRGDATLRGADEFRRSYKRPKWDVAQP